MDYSPRISGIICNSGKLNEPTCTMLKQLTACRLLSSLGHQPHMDLLLASRRSILDFVSECHDAVSLHPPVLLGLRVDFWQVPAFTSKAGGPFHPVNFRSL